MKGIIKKIAKSGPLYFIKQRQPTSSSAKSPQCPYRWGVPLLSLACLQCMHIGCSYNIYSIEGNLTSNIRKKLIRVCKDLYSGIYKKQYNNIGERVSNLINLCSEERVYVTLRRLIPYVEISNEVFDKISTQHRQAILDAVDEFCSTWVVIRRGTSAIEEITVRTSVAYSLLLNNAHSCINAQEKLREAKVLAYHSVGLGKLLNVLTNDEVTAIFCDGPNHPVYYDTRNGGRTITQVRLNLKDFQRICNFAELVSGYPISEFTPSLKCDIRTRDFFVRLSIDRAPLTETSFSIDIRRFPLKPLRLGDLTSLGFIASHQAEFLKRSVLQRKNIAIVGDVYSGKTTLANALLMEIPQTWRVFTLEDVLESPPLPSVGVKIRVPPLEAPYKYTTKSKEIEKLLHRSPDYVYFGEIQTQDHVSALFHALVAGLRGVFTFHANSPEDAITRWTHVYHVPIEAVRCLHILVFTVRKFKPEGGVSRKVDGIYLLHKGNDSIVIKQVHFD